MNGEVLSEAGQATTTAGMASGVPWVMGLGIATNLIGGLLSSAARKKEEERRRQFEGTMMGLQTQAGAAKAQTQGEVDAFHQMMQGYQNSLIR